MPLIDYPDIAFSRVMGVALFLVANASNLLYGYLFASLTLDLLGKSASPGRRLLYAFFTCVLFQSIFVFAPYAFAEIPWHTALRPFLATPNPIRVFLFYYFGVRVLQLPKYRLVHLLVLLYLFCLYSVCISRVFKMEFFAQVPGEEPHNYLMDILSTLVGTLSHLASYFLVRTLIRWKNYTARYSDSLLTASLPEKLASAFLYACLAYTLAVLTEFLCAGNDTCLLWLCIILALSIAVGTYRLIVKAGRMMAQNKDAHIRALSGAVDEFRGVKHDFYNVLGTYSAYISLGSVERLQAYHEKLLSSTVSAGDQMDILQKLAQIPTLATLIAQKQERAARCGIQFRMLVEGNIPDMYIDELDQCRVMANLLDNAIEAAAESAGKRVSLLIKTKENGNILIVLTNTFAGQVDMRRLIVPGYTGKQGHSGLGLMQVRRILNQYPNCSIQFGADGHYFSVYWEISPA